MSRLLAFLVVMYPILAACGPPNTLIAVNMLFQTPTVTLPPTFSPTVIPTGNKVDQPDSSVHIWSPGGNGWALRIREKILIFDYVGGTDPTLPASGGARIFDEIVAVEKTD